MSLTKDDIDAVSMMLRVNGDPTFMILMTRGGLTKRRGSSDEVDPVPVTVTGRTDDCFEHFMAALPEALLEQGGVLEDGGREGPRHDWRFEFGGGLNSLAYDISYHWGSAALPDEFADMVVLAERLTHSWYLVGVAEETGAPLPASSGPPPEAATGTTAREPASGAAGTLGRTRGKAVQPTLAKRERIALAVLLDWLAFSIPFSFLHWLFVRGGERTGPPGGSVALFAILEFVLLYIARRSPGYWLLGISAPLGGKPHVDPQWRLRESRVTLAVGILSCGLGVAGLTSWTAYHVAIPYFGLPFPLWLSIPSTLLGSIGLVLSGALVLRLDVRGVWLGGGLALAMLLAGTTGWGGWGDFIENALAARSASVGRSSGAGLLGWARDVGSALVITVPVLLLGGLVSCWKRFGRRPAGVAGAPAIGS